jgi:hypothetical protein
MPNGYIWQTISEPGPSLTSGLLTIHLELLSPLQVDEQDYLPSDHSLVAISSTQTLGVRLIAAVDQPANRAGQEPKYAGGHH